MQSTPYRLNDLEICKPLMLVGSNPRHLKPYWYLELFRAYLSCFPPLVSEWHFPQMPSHGASQRMLHSNYNLPVALWPKVQARPFSHEGVQTRLSSQEGCIPPHEDVQVRLPSHQDVQARLPSDEGAQACLPSHEGVQASLPSHAVAWLRNVWYYLVCWLV